MKFTSATRSLMSLSKHPAFRRAVATACLAGVEAFNVTILAEAIASRAHTSVVTSRMWEDARDKRRNAKRHNAQVTAARDEVRNIIELVAGAVGASVSATKHALETQHSVVIMQPVVLSVTELTEKGVMELKAQNVQLGMRKGKLHKMVPTDVPFEELEKHLYEQVRQFYLVVNTVKAI